MRLFVISDIHGFYDEMIKSLNEAGFNKDTDILISLGDNIDRGKQPKEVIDYLYSLPNKVLIRGNHEDLFQDACMRGYPLYHDYCNGTHQSICMLNNDDVYSNQYHNLKKNTDCYRYRCIISNDMVDYFETKNYIFVHSFLPTKKELGHEYVINNWKEAENSKWEDARWGNPFGLMKTVLNIPKKTIVFGHFHTSYANKMDGKCIEEFGEGADFSINYGSNYIGIDACTAHSHKVNCLVLEDELI